MEVLVAHGQESGFYSIDSGKPLESLKPGTKC